MRNPAAALGGETAVPGDKSISHRALMLGARVETAGPTGRLSNAAERPLAARSLPCVKGGA